MHGAVCFLSHETLKAQIDALAHDESLNSEGVISAKNTAVLFKQSGLKPDVVFTSLLTQCIETAQIVLAGMGMWSTPMSSSWRLNPRRRGVASFAADHHQLFPLHVELPTTETLCDLEQRVLPFWFDAAAPALMRGKTVMLSGHIDSLEVIVRRLAPSVPLAPGAAVFIRVSHILEGLGVEVLRMAHLAAEERLSDRELRKLRRAVGQETADERAARKERNQQRKLRMQLKSSSSRALSSAESNTSIHLMSDGPCMSSHVFSVPEEAICVESKNKVDADQNDAMNIVEEREGVETTVEKDQKATVESTICAEFEDKVDVDQTDSVNVVEERKCEDYCGKRAPEGYSRIYHLR
ncbi:MAG: uncharacterized protein KVP18_002752 [Porospora cf. gigantea A]|uniref:uncharacterized protein n=1 Tax=Porospora cf. gigantea A TaxID=2853593 RepID=UPI00355A5774|nr:MAG: hypothetical protein KVP18_002752 [Porospora cf. gigantea A]